MTGTKAIAAVLCAMVVAGCAAATSGAAPVAKSKGATPPATKAQKEIAWYEAKIAERPSNYPYYAQLGRALLDRARETHDPMVLARARSVLRRSIELQPNFEALIALASVSNFGHRFEEGKEWARKARGMATGVSGSENQAIALLVEAHLGLGEYDEARALLPADGKTDDFRIAAALGQWAALMDRPDDALAAFQRAAELARKEKVAELEAWAQIVSGGVYIDTGRAPLAAPHLEAAAKLDPDSKVLAIHRAEVAEAAGDTAGALAIYERLLAGAPDAELGRHAWRLAKALGREEAARKHFEDTQAACIEAIQAGEIYTLGELAQLWADAGVHLDQAARLAKENLVFKRDKAAVKTAEQLRIHAAGAAPRNAE